MFAESFISDFNLAMLCCTTLGISFTLSFFTLGSWKVPLYIPIDRDTDENGEKKRRVLFVIAHPDDECMFFGPSILHFTQKENAEVFLLCLSTGNYHKQGKIRCNELLQSCQKLGICSSNVIVYDSGLFPDEPNIVWPTIKLSRVLDHHIHALDIDMVVSFDSYGVSGHLNHSALFSALEHLIDEGEIPKRCDVYVLDSVNIFRKYCFILDLFYSYFFAKCSFTVELKQLSVIQSAMKAHTSQYVWFRKLYIFFSRYVYINTLRKLNSPFNETDRRNKIIEKPCIRAIDVKQLLSQKPKPRYVLGLHDPDET